MNSLILDNITLLVGNFLSLISSIFNVPIGLTKDKKKILFWGIAQKGFACISNIVLSGYTGAINNIAGIVRNILCYTGKLTIKNKIVLAVFQIILCLAFNRLGVLGFLPLIATLSCTFLMTYDANRLKVLSVTTTVLWAIYNLFLKNYIAFVFDVFTIISNLIGLYRIQRKGPVNEK